MKATKDDEENALQGLLLVRSPSFRARGDSVATIYKFPTNDLFVDDHGKKRKGNWEKKTVTSDNELYLFRGMQKVFCCF